MALKEVNPSHGRQPLEIVHAEIQGTIHHAVDRESMLLRIDIGEVGGVLLHEVERGRCNDSHIILKRSVVRDMINAESRPPTQELAAVVGIFGFQFRLG